MAIYTPCQVPELTGMYEQSCYMPEMIRMLRDQPLRGSRPCDVWPWRVDVDAQYAKHHTMVDCWKQITQRKAISSVSVCLSVDRCGRHSVDTLHHFNWVGQNTDITCDDLTDLLQVTYSQRYLKNINHHANNAMDLARRVLLMCTVAHALLFHGCTVVDCFVFHLWLPVCLSVGRSG